MSVSSDSLMSNDSSKDVCIVVDTVSVVVVVMVNEVIDGVIGFDVLYVDCWVVVVVVDEEIEDKSARANCLVDGGLCFDTVRVMGTEIRARFRSQ